MPLSWQLGSRSYENIVSTSYNIYNKENCCQFEGAVISSALRGALPRHDTSLKLRLSFESSRVWKILTLISDWELGNRDELPLVMASGQRSATCSTAQPWAIKPDSQEHLKPAASPCPTWSANVGFSLSPDKFPTVHFPRTTREGRVATLLTTFFKKKPTHTQHDWNNPEYWTPEKKCRRLMEGSDAVLSFNLDDRAATSAVLQEKLVKAQLFLPVVALGINIDMQGIWRCCVETCPRWVSAYLSPVLSKTFSSVSLLCWPHSSLHY